MMLWKAADQQGPPQVDITQFGWEVQGGITSACIDAGLPAPRGFIDVINCGCKPEGKHVAQRIVTATEITCRALSIVHAQRPIGVATHT